MRIVIQRVSEAAVTIEGKVHSSIGQGLMVLAGFENCDTEKPIDWLCAKIVNMRIFSDSEGKMNLSLLDAGGEILAVSQFTLHASTRKGNRPSFIRAAPPAISEPLYNMFVKRLGELLGKPVATGIFGADMKIMLINDGPVTIVMDTEDTQY
jgi:D-tyrosyl-tRNA(Tyr) deacylase